MKSIITNGDKNLLIANIMKINDTLNIIDDLLEEDGYICIYNAKYLFNIPPKHIAKIVIQDTGKQRFPGHTLNWEILRPLLHECVFVGYDKDYEGDETFIQLSGENTFSSFLNSLNALTPMAFFIGTIGLLILMAYETKWMKSQKIFQLQHYGLLDLMLL